MTDKSKSDDRKARTAAALRANLKRRKAAARKAKSANPPPSTDKPS